MRAMEEPFNITARGAYSCNTQQRVSEGLIVAEGLMR
jgi:hypothetical protein